MKKFTYDEIIKELENHAILTPLLLCPDCSKDKKCSFLHLDFSNVGYGVFSLKCHKCNKRFFIARGKEDNKAYW